jgi:hypothetical protein
MTNTEYIQNIYDERKCAVLYGGFPFQTFFNRLVTSSSFLMTISPISRVPKFKKSLSAIA